MPFAETTGAYSEILNPVKDPERSFAINISELLQNYVSSFIAGSVNFNSAALMIQGSSSIYGKKVEYLHNLATKLFASLVKNKKEEGAKKDAKEKEKHSKESKFSDPFFSTEIKLGKNLSCLRKKFTAKNASNKKTSKKSDKMAAFIPVDLLPMEGEDKGMELLDVSGTVVGNKNDFTLNKCRVTSSGWMLLPTVSSDLVPSPCAISDYTIVDDHSDDDDVCNDSYSHTPESNSPDEGFVPSSANSDIPASNPYSQGTSAVPSSQGTDEGIESLPCTPLENGSQPEFGTTKEESSEPESNTTPIANASLTETPMEGVQEGPDDLNHDLEGNENLPLKDTGAIPKPRRSMRNALKQCQLQQVEASKQAEGNVAKVREKEVAVCKRSIKKQSTYSLPAKLKGGGKDKKLVPASEFCARSFFSINEKNKNLLLQFQVPAFRINITLTGELASIQKSLQGFYQKKRSKNSGDVDDDNDDDFADDDFADDDFADDDDQMEPEMQLGDPMENDCIMPIPHEDAEIVIKKSHVLLPTDMSDDENPIAEEEPMLDEGESPFAEGLDNDLTEYNIKELESSFQHAASRQCELAKRDLGKYMQSSDMAQKLREWEDTMKPYLKELNEREEFDINLYGSRIVSAFEDNDRKQTIIFRNFVKGKEKWEIHRYFMALLPLVNVGNVSIEPEKRQDGGEDISVSLLSRKMHHKELEEFGHNEGEHS